MGRPESSVTGVFVSRENLDTDMHLEERPFEDTARR